MGSLLEKLDRTVDSFIAYIEGLPPEELAARAWGPREVLVHLVFWHETFVAALEALLDQREPRLPRGTFAELNAAAVKANAGVAVPELIRRFREAQGRLTELVGRAARAGDRTLAIPVKAGSRPRTQASPKCRACVKLDFPRHGGG
ncbi:MAG TPA: DinB family protein [Thermaerobacter sp.]